VPKLPSVVKSLADGPYREADYILGLPKLPVTKRIADDAKVTDHHAIIPTGVKKDFSGLTNDERAVFDRVARNFLAAFHPHYIYKATTVITEVKGHTFVSKGKTVLDEGWRILYKKDKEPESEPLPDLTTGEGVRVTKAETKQKKTQPPAPYTEATLLSAMENAGRFTEDETLKEELKRSGLGTPATRAAIIERLLEVGYAERKRKALIPTEKGMKLIETVPKELRSPETTGKWERGLSRIASGEMEAGRFMESIKKYVNFIIESAKTAERF
jgi:DNA topoisomerase-3